MLNINRSIINILLASTLFTAAASEASNCGKVFNGTIERVRVQEQANGDTIMLLKGKEKGVEMTGYTNDSSTIT
jgi:hypothetical protein